MNLTYLILAHENLSLISELIKALTQENVNFYIHIDAKCKEDITIFNDLKNVKLSTNRFNVLWGEFSVTEALMYSLNEISNTIQTDYVILLSGADFPVKTNEYIYEYIHKYHSKDFVTGLKLPSPKCCWVEGGRRRIECYALKLKSKNIATIEPLKFTWQNIRQFAKTATKSPDKIYKFLKIWATKPQRKHFKSLTPYVGELWCGLRISSIKLILNYCQKHPEYLEYHKDTALSDELVIPTLIYNLIPQTEIKNDCLRYINWVGENVKSPTDININDKELLNEILSNPKYLFARKFKSSDLNTVLQMIRNIQKPVR